LEHPLQLRLVGAIHEFPHLVSIRGRREMDKTEKHNIKRFNKWASSYDTGLVSIFFRMCYRKIRPLLNLQDGMRLLDSGCGTGSLLKELSESGKELNLYGIDLSPEMIEAARVKLKDEKHIELYEGSAADLPFQSNYFDYVVCMNSLHHHANPNQSVVEMTRVLKPGGVMILMDGFVDSTVRKILSRTANVIRNEGKVQRFRREELRRIFRSLEYESITQQTYLFFMLITCGTKA
jgi:ubiquinone/menaquinone biosynthesis C-methylase UbiE